MKYKKNNPNILNNCKTKGLFFFFKYSQNKTYLKASTSSGVKGILFPKRREPVSVIR